MRPLVVHQRRGRLERLVAQRTVVRLVVVGRRPLDDDGPGVPGAVRRRVLRLPSALALRRRSRGRGRAAHRRARR